MANSFFKFKQFTIQQDRCAMKVTTDACLFGAWAASVIKNEKIKIKNVVDIGAGTALLSLMIAQQNKDLFIQSVELDKEAAEQAKENADNSPFNKQVEVIEADIRFFQPGIKYDCIISNPPFYENELRSADTAKNKAHHSSELSSGELFSFITTHLDKDGIFFLLLPYKRNDELTSLIQKHGLFVQGKVLVRPTAQHNWFRVMIRGSKKEA
ncbi:MAG: methyltransferase, partial [Bacteroidetes bacterium]|nr:methyltransferase [Bacteroidota bacterium]